MTAEIGMEKVFEKPRGLTDAQTNYCPGCTHGVAHRLVAEVLEDMDVLPRTIGVASVGCSVFAYDYFNVDMQQAAHGRAPAVATGIKRVHPDRVVFTYQGDGDLASIGMGEIVHAAARGERFTVIFINNAVYGMTGGQMAPTTMVGMSTSTTPGGRDDGFPIRVAEMLATLDGPAYVARGSLHDPAHIMRAKKLLARAFRAQVRGLGFSLVELLSTCNVAWGVSPVEALKWIEEHMLPVYPLGEFKVAPGLS